MSHVRVRLPDGRGWSGEVKNPVEFVQQLADSTGLIVAYATEAGPGTFKPEVEVFPRGAMPGGVTEQ